MDGSACRTWPRGQRGESHAFGPPSVWPPRVPMSLPDLNFYGITSCFPSSSFLPPSLFPDKKLHQYYLQGFLSFSLYYYRSKPQPASLPSLPSISLSFFSSFQLPTQLNSRRAFLKAGRGGRREEMRPGRSRERRADLPDKHKSNERGKGQNERERQSRGDRGANLADEKK